MDPVFWKGKRVLITGHTGFKGTWLLLWLRQLGAEVWGYSLGDGKEESATFKSYLRNEPPGDEWFHQLDDINSFESIRRCVQDCQPDVVFHLAAQALVLHSYGNPIETWSTNLLGSINLLESVKPLKKDCAVVMVTTDKVYENRGRSYGYSEGDRLGGHDPYSASKAAAEIAVASWRDSFCGKLPHQNENLRVATARAGNVIGGGDWAANRIVPDSVRALQQGKPIKLRNPNATRPWQHVLEPLSGYLRLAESLLREERPPCEAFNFGPRPDSQRTVKDLVERMLSWWEGSWEDHSGHSDYHEACLLSLQIDKAYRVLRWEPRWSFNETVDRTIRWYKDVQQGRDPIECCLEDLYDYSTRLTNRECI